MSLAALDRPASVPSTAPQPPSPVVRALPPVVQTAPAPAPRQVPAAEPVPTGARPRPVAVPQGTEARGFVLYVGLDEQTAVDAGVDLATLVDALKSTLARLAPEAQTHAAVALAPQGAGGVNLDVVRLALQDPSAVAKHRGQDAASARPTDPATASGITIDVSRKRVVLDDEVLALTYTEYELLQFLVLREGRTVERAELIAGIWTEGGEEQPNERTIDVHVRRLRAKLGDYEEIVRTVRGAGYRFDRHADVHIVHSSTPSPDFF